MNLIEFSEILQKPHLVSKEETESIDNILKEFPFFQAAQVINLYNLKKQHSFKYNNALKRTAAYTTNRSVLFDFITTEDFEFENFVSSDNISIKEIELVDAETIEVKEYKSIELDLEVDDSPLPIGKPFQFKISDSFSFNEWLTLSKIEPIDRETQTEETDIKQEIKQKEVQSKTSLIDKFIATNPKIKPVSSFEFSNIVNQDEIDNENLMTETLAHVYLEQKKYAKAITAFHILSLKYPEKSSFFANQIEEIEKIKKI